MDRLAVGESDLACMLSCAIVFVSRVHPKVVFVRVCVSQHSPDILNSDSVSLLECWILNGARHLFYLFRRRKSLL